MSYYLDTSSILKLYKNEIYSSEVRAWVSSQKSGIPFTLFHEVEFVNAVSRGVFVGMLSESDNEDILGAHKEDFQNNVFYRPQINIEEAFIESIQQLSKYSTTIGTRALDIIHVSIAKILKVDVFVTSDKQQRELATLNGMSTIYFGN